MDAKEFVIKIRRLHSLQGVTVRFAITGMTGLFRLYGLMKNNPSVRLANENDKIVILAIMNENNWGSDRNRIYTLHGLQTADDGWLTEIAKDVESINVSDHSAKSIMSGRQKMSEEAAEKIIAAVLTADILAEAKSWGFVVEGKLSRWDDIPCVDFLLSQGNAKPFVMVTLDAWSGRIAVNQKLGGQMYVRPDQIQTILRFRMEAKAEELTAA